MNKRNIETARSYPAAKTAQAAWNAIRTTNAPAAEKNKVKEEFKRAALKVLEEHTGETLVRSRRGKAQAR